MLCQIPVEKVVTKGEIATLSNFNFCNNVYNSRLLQRRQKASTCGKGLTSHCLGLCIVS